MEVETVSVSVPPSTTAKPSGNTTIRRRGKMKKTPFFRWTEQGLIIFHRETQEIFESREGPVFLNKIIQGILFL